MKLFFKIALILTTVFLLYSCDQNRIYEYNQDIENLAWVYADTLRFEVEINNFSEMNAYINIRHSFYFVWRNIWLQMNVYQKDSLVYQEPINVQLSQPNGHWHGKCTGDICFYQYSLKDFTNYTFPNIGVYRFEFVQDMRENPLKNISSIGFRLEFSEQND